MADNPNAEAGPSSLAANVSPPAAATTGDAAASSALVARGVADSKGKADAAAAVDSDRERCCICLMGFLDRTLVRCGHQFCFKCIGVWANQSRRCPLCNAEMGDYLEHELESGTPTKFFLPPLPSPFTTKRAPLSPLHTAANRAEQAALSRRRDIYARGLWAKHLASNGYTGFRANPTPRDLATDGVTAGRARTFLKRELRVWYETNPKAAVAASGRGVSVDGSPREGAIEDVAEHIVSLLRSVDIRSPVTVSLLHPLVGSYAQAQHLAHELYTFLRSPYSALDDYDAVVTYDDEPTDPFPEAARSEDRHGDSMSPTIDSRSDSGSLSSRGRSRSRYRSRSLSRSRSRSPCSDASSYYSRRRRPRRSRSRSVSLSRDISRADKFAPPPARGERRWDQADSWIDPSYERELAAASKRRKRKEQRTRQRERRREAAAAEEDRADGRRDIGGDSSRPQQQHPGDVGASRARRAQTREEPRGATFGRALAGAGITVRGASERRQSLLDRLAKAKAEGRTSVQHAATSAPGTSASDAGGGDALLARISEGSAALAAKRTSPPTTTRGTGSRGSTPAHAPAAATAPVEERASELRAKLITERKRKMLREQLLARKRAKTSPEAAPAPAPESASAEV